MMYGCKFLLYCTVLLDYGHFKLLMENKFFLLDFVTLYNQIIVVLTNCAMRHSVTHKRFLTHMQLYLLYPACLLTENITICLELYL